MKTTENIGKRLLMENIIRTEVSAYEPLYRKWWVWAIAGAVVLGLFAPSRSTDSSSLKPDTSAPNIVPSAQNLWGDWWTLNETNWVSLTNSFTQDFETSDEVAVAIDNAIYYGGFITPLPDARAQSLFDQWFMNMKAARAAFDAGDFNLSANLLESASLNMTGLSDYIVGEA